MNFRNKNDDFCEMFKLDIDSGWDITILEEITFRTIHTYYLSAAITCLY